MTGLDGGKIVMPPIGDPTLHDEGTTGDTIVDDGAAIVVEEDDDDERDGCGGGGCVEGEAETRVLGLLGRVGAPRLITGSSEGSGRKLYKLALAAGQ